MQKVDTSLEGVWELRPQVFRDTRGFFLETYKQKKYEELGITASFIQDNHSCSSKGTLRGLHYQLNHPQGKLCRVVEGEALDVAVDIRAGSPTFGQWTSVLLSAKLHNQIYVPPGFAHGFVALSDTVQFLYKCSDSYDPSDEYGVRWDDPELGIRWGVPDPLLSEKDRKYPFLGAISAELLPKYSQQ